MTALTLGSDLPDFALEEPATGKTIASRSMEPQSPMVVVFTQNHCPHAQAWEERLLQIARDYEGRSAMVFISSSDPEQHSVNGPEGIADRTRERKYPVPYLFDADQSIAHAFGAVRTPDVFVFDRGQLAYHGTVDDNQEEPDHVTLNYVRAALDALLSGDGVAIPETALIGCGIKWKPGNAPA
jgi:peroxiredoxin